MQLQRGLVLHARPYSETSLIIDFFSENDGRLALLAKGARAKRSSLKGVLQPFTPLLVAWSGRGDLRTLRQAEASSLALPLAGNSLFSAMYLNELLARLLPAHTPFPELFLDYVAALTALAKANCLETALRHFEFALLAALGYGVDFNHCAATGAPITADAHYHFDPQCGFITELAPSAHSFSGAALHTFARREFSDNIALAAAKRFTRLALKPYLGATPLKSRELFLSPIRKL